jgi:hypothetical protein
MKADHRHELKTNELAEWISNFPQWAKQNPTTIIVVMAVLAAVLGFYIWKFYFKGAALAGRQLHLTSLINQIAVDKTRVIQSHSEGRDLSFILLQPAEELLNFAQETPDDQMAALALIKRAELLRTELHYRMGTVSEQEITDQINRAKMSYTEAMKRASSNPSLVAEAKFGLGLCEEEIGNFNGAEQIYRDIVADPNFEGTVIQAAAQHRLETMDDYKTKIVFRPAPQPGPTVEPPVQMQPAEINLPADAETNLPVDIDVGLQSPNATVEETPSEIELDLPDDVEGAVETDLTDE